MFALPVATASHVSSRLTQRLTNRALINALLSLFCFAVNAPSVFAVNLAVILMPVDGTTTVVRVLIPGGPEPDLSVTSIAATGPYRVVLSWPNVDVTLDRPLTVVPAEGFGSLRALALKGTPGNVRLEMEVTQPVRPMLLRAPDGWSLRLEAAALTASAVAGRAAVKFAAPHVLPTDLASAAVGSTPPTAPLKPPLVAAVHTIPPAVTNGGDNGNKKGPSSAPKRPELLLLEVTINGQRLKEVVRAERSEDGALLLPIDTWTEARLAPLGQRRVLSDGTAAYALDEVAAASYRVDRGDLTLSIEAPASAFVGSALAGQSTSLAPPVRDEPGVMVNYDVSVSRSGGSGRPIAGATLEAIAFNQYGSFVTSGLVRSDAGSGGVKAVSTLDTYWRYDMPQRLETLVVGDTVGVGGGWSRPARYGGVRWGRDFGMRPGFITLPQIALAGEAALPSTVEVLVNNARTMSQPVAPGPFALTNVPLVTGAGQLNLVVRDLLGRETVVQQSYYASPRLLAPDITDFSFEAGWLRTGYGLDSRYVDPFMAGTFRRGLNNRLTGEGRLELQRDRQAGGLELAGLLGDWAVARTAVALSSSHTQGPTDRGLLFQAGIERSGAQGGASLQYEYASRGFTPFAEGAAPTVAERRARERWLASVGGVWSGSMSGGLNFVRQTQWNGEHVTVAGAALSLALWRGASMGVQVSKRIDGEKNWTAGVNVNVPLDNGLSTSARVNREATGQVSASVAASQSPQSGPGFGWRAELSTVSSQLARGGALFNTSYAEHDAELASDRQGHISARAGTRGTVGWLAGVPFASRPVGDGAVAVVEVEGLAGIPVMRAHQVVAVTDSQGRAFVPRLLPWQANQIEIDPSELPMDVEINDVVQQVTPYARSGARVKFDIRRTRQALVVLQQAGGQPVPVGARVAALPGGGEFVVGRRGEVWLTELGVDKQRITVSWKGGFCDMLLAIPPPAADGSLGKLGPLLCEGKKP